LVIKTIDLTLNDALTTTLGAVSTTGYSTHASTPPSPVVTTPATKATIGGEFQVNTFSTSHQSASSITALTDGGFVATWQSFGQDGDGYGVFGQRFDSAGQAVTTASAATGISTLDLSSLNLNQGDRITLTIAGGTQVQGAIGSDGDLDTLLTSMASDVASQTGLFSNASSTSGVLTLTGLTDGSAMAGITVTLES